MKLPLFQCRSTMCLCVHHDICTMRTIVTTVLCFMFLLFVVMFWPTGDGMTMRSSLIEVISNSAQQYICAHHCSNSNSTNPCCKLERPFYFFAMYYSAKLFPKEQYSTISLLFSATTHIFMNRFHQMVCLSHPYSLIIHASIPPNKCADDMITASDKASHFPYHPSLFHFQQSLRCQHHQRRCHCHLSLLPLVVCWLLPSRLSI